MKTSLAKNTRAGNQTSVKNDSTFVKCALIAIFGSDCYSADVLRSGRLNTIGMDTLSGIDLGVIVRGKSTGIYDAFNSRSGIICYPEEYTVKQGDTLSSILSGKGIFPDSRSIQFIVDINPGIVDKNIIKSGDKILIPEVNVIGFLEGNSNVFMPYDQIKRNTSFGFEGFEFRPNQQLAINVRHEATKMKRAIGEFERDPANLLDKGNNKTAISTLRSIHSSINTIIKNTEIASRQLIEDVNQASQDINFILEQSRKEKRALSAEEISEINQIGGDIRHQSSDLESGGSGTLPVTIHTMNKAGNHVKGLRIKFAPYRRKDIAERAKHDLNPENWTA